MFTDNKDFYPTPKALFHKLMNGQRHLSGRILEPSAGKGDLIRYISALTGRRDNPPIDAIESDEKLVNTLMAEGINVVWNDFLTYETYKEYDFIVMNPPFSNGVDHVLKALELAEAQLSHCVIYAILNKQTIDNAYSTKRQALLRKLDEHKADVRYIKDGFSDAERKTDVKVALIKVSVEKAGKGRSIYDSIPFFATDREETQEALESSLSTYVKSNEVADKLNGIERLIIEYETACELAKEAYETLKEKESFFNYIHTVNRREGSYDSPLSLIATERFESDNLNDELDRLRRGYWELILDTKDFRELLTNEAIQKLNRQMSVANEMEINLTNIRMLLTALASNQRNILTDSVVSIFEKITTYHMNEYSTNIHYYDGWKTNDAYRINGKIIIPIKHEFDSWDFKEDYGQLFSSGVKPWIVDIVKAFQLIDEGVPSDFEYIGNNSFENGLLRFRMFKNGNIHVWFNDKKLLAKLNYLCGQHFAWIPSDGEQKANEEAREWVAQEFGDMGEVTLIGGA